MMMMWGNGGPGMFGWIGMGLGMILNLGIVILIIYFMARVFSRGGFVNNNISSNAIEILKERYARGEIDEDEYHKRLEVLNKR